MKTKTTTISALTIATLKGGDPNGLRGDDTIWTDLEPCDGPDVWRVLVASKSAAEATAENTGAELLSAEEWDGSDFGDGAIGLVSSPRPGVMMCRYPDGPTGLPEGWRVYRVASPDDFIGCDPVDASEPANWPETGDDEPVEPSEIVRYTSPDKPAITVAVYREEHRAAVRWNDGWDWTDLYKTGETTREILARYLAGDMRE